MSSIVETKTTEAAAAQFHWALWRRQIMAILRLEVRKNLFGKRSVLIYLLTSLPLLIMVPFSFVARNEINNNFADGLQIYAGIYDGLILRTVVFFGCAWMFMNLFRGELVDKSLHYYFLTAIRRDVLLVGKYLSGVLTTGGLFAGMTAVTVILLHVPRGFSTSVRYMFQGPGLSQVAAYLSITILACVGYGAIFLVIGLFFRNPIVPALLVYGWEAINFLLPPILKRFSVIFYLQSLTPVPMSEGPFAIVATPSPVWVAVPILVVLTAAVLFVASLRIRRIEIRYAGE